MITVLLAIGFGLMIGGLLGLVGGGGSILTVPILVYVLDINVHQATATSLVIVGISGLAGMVPHARAGNVRVFVAIQFGVVGIFGAAIGKSISDRLSGPVLLLLFGVLMMIVAGRMIIARRARGDREPSTVIRSSFHWTTILAGLVVCVLTGLFGVGGGFLIVPALVMVLGYPMRLAIGTSLLVIALNSVSAVVVQLQDNRVVWETALLFVTGGLVGAVIGGRLAGRVNEARLANGFAFMTATVGVALVAQNARSVF